MEVSDPKLFIKQEAEPKLDGIDEIIRVFSPRNKGSKGNVIEKMAMKHKVPAQKHRGGNQSFF